MKKKGTTGIKNSKKKKKKYFYINENVRIVILTIFTILMIILKFYSNYYILKDIQNTSILYTLYKFIYVIVGDLYIPIICINIVYIIYKFINENYKIYFINKSFYLYFSIYIFTLIYNSKVLDNLGFDYTISVFKAYNELLKSSRGTKVISIISLPFYKLSYFKYYYNILYVLISFSILLFFSSFIISFIKAYIKWRKYINSKEYSQKKEELIKKREIQKRNIMAKKQAQVDFISDFLIDRTNNNLEKKYQILNEDELYSNVITKEIKDKKLDEEISKQENFENEIYIGNTENELYVQNEKVEITDNLEKLQDIENVQNIENEIIKQDEHLIDNEDTKKYLDKEQENKNIKQEIDSIFVHKSMDEQKKKEMIDIIEKNIIDLENVLKKFKIDAKVVNYAVGPTITRYELTIPLGTSVKKVLSLSDDIALNLAAESLRIEAPIPGKSAIGIEIPNKIKEPVYFSNLINSKEFDNKILPVVVGKNVVGEDKILDIVKMPHLLIAGTTGSGKSVFINSIISSLISKKSYDEVKFIMIDPKMVELSSYNDIPHLLLPVIIEPEKASIALKWAVNEMERRYKYLSDLNLKDIKKHNEIYSNNKLPYIVIVIDELADLMMVASNSVEISIARIAQKARAIGIHLIVATQRPSTDVVTGMIKANLPSRISFTLRSNVDSRTILDQIGAEKLLGNGDMLLLENGTAKLERIQGAYILDDEINKITSVLKNSIKVEYDYSILEEDEEEKLDPLFNKVVEYLENKDIEKITISMIQQKFSVGYNRASNLVSSLRERAIIDDNNYILK